MRNREMRLTIWSITLLLALGAAVGAPAIAAPASPYVFSVSPGSTCTAGYGPQSVPITVSIHSATGKLLARKHQTTLAIDGSFDLCIDKPIVPGDKLVVKGALGTHTLTLPTMTAKVNRASNVLRGQASPHRALDLWVYACTPNTCMLSHMLTDTSGSGAFSRNLTGDGIDIDGSDWVQVNFTTPGGDHIYTIARAPYLVVREIAPNEITYQAASPGPTTITLRSPGGSLLAQKTVHATNAGGYRTRLVKHGQPVPIKAGDIVTGSFAADARLTVPPLGLTFDAGADTVSGTCFPSQAYFLQIQKSPSSWDSYSGSTHPDGSFDKLATGGIDSGNSATVDCEDRRGDQVRLTGTAP